MLQPGEMPYLISNRSDEGPVVDQVYVKNLVVHKQRPTNMATAQLPPLETSSPQPNGTPVAPANSTPASQSAQPGQALGTQSAPISATRNSTADAPTKPTLSTQPDGWMYAKASQQSQAAQQAGTQSAPTSASPNLTQDTPTSPTGSKSPDGSLRAPLSQQPHRVSSPPRFSADQFPKPTIPPLQHRHTLEVPRLTRHSQTFSPEDSAVANGRISPTTPSRTRKGSLTLGRRKTHSVNSDTLQSDIGQDEDVSRMAEAIRQKRATRKKRKDDDDDRVVVGTKVDQNHVNWVTAYNMLTGIRFTVSRAHAKIGVEQLKTLTEDDFTSQHKFSFDVIGSELTPAAKYDFKFKDYSPEVFMNLRTMFGIQPADYLVSLTSKYILSELGSPGKSGSFFYFSRDYKYIIKTIHHAEHRCLRKVLKEYYQHVQDNRNTLLSQFYGLHRVKLPYGRKIHFVVMNNLFPPHRDIHQTFDLKGSTVGRDLKEEEVEKNPRAVLKDLNWLRRGLHLEFGPSKKEIFMQQLERDVALLQRLKIMDYSLLVGIHDLSKGNEENLRDKTLQVFQPGGPDDDPHPLLSDDASLQHLSQLTNFATANPALGGLARTPSKLESAQKAKELRANLKTHKPVPMGSITASSRNTSASTVLANLHPAVGASIGPSSSTTATSPGAAGVASAQHTSGLPSLQQPQNDQAHSRQAGALDGHSSQPGDAGSSWSGNASDTRGFSSSTIHSQHPATTPSSPEFKGLDELNVGPHRTRHRFYADDGGFRATRSDDSPGEEIYYLGIIDCLTKFNMVKRGEHWWKDLTMRKGKSTKKMNKRNKDPSADEGAGGGEKSAAAAAATTAPDKPPAQVKHEISAVPPERYGERFVKFMASITKPRDAPADDREREKEKRVSSDSDAAVAVHSSTGAQHQQQQSGGSNLPVVIEKAGEA